MEELLLSLFSLLGVFCSLMVIRASNGVYSVLYLVLVFCNMGGLLILYEVEFIGLILIMVYVGAVAVLFLFIVMMVGHELVDDKRSKWVDRVFWNGFGVLVLYELLFVSSMEREGLVEYKSEFDRVSNIEGIGEVLFTVELYNVLVGGFVLLVAMIGGIVLAVEKR